MIKPIDDGLPFLMWLESVRAQLPSSAYDPNVSAIHAAYSAGGLEMATRLCEQVINKEHAIKGDVSPSVVRGWNHFLIYLWELGLRNPRTKEETKKVIQSREDYNDRP